MEGGSPVRLRLLGPVTLDGQPAPGPRTLALGAMLALADGPLSRAEVARLLWERSSPPQARASLRQCLVQWRRIGAAAIESDRMTLWRNRKALVTDVDELMASASSELWAERLAGAGLPLGLPTIGRAVEAWVTDARQRLVERLSLAFAARRGGWSHAEAEPVEAALRRMGGLARPSPVIAARPIPRPASDPLGRPRLVVACTEGEEAERRLGETIRQELIAAFARFRELVVIEARHMLSELELPDTVHQYVLAPHIALVGGAIRFTVRLLRAPELEALWSEAMIVDEAGVAGVEALAGRLVQSLLPTLERDAVEVPQIAGAPWRAYLEARAAAHAPAGPAQARLAAQRLETLVAQHPGFVGAKLALARLLNTELAYTSAGFTGPAERARAMRLVSEAVRLEPLQPRCWTHLAWCHLWAGQWSASQQAIERGLALSRLQPARLNEAAFACLHLGRLDEAEGLLADSRSLLDAPDAAWHNSVGLLRLLQGRPLEALDAFEAADTLYVWTGVYGLAARAAAGLETGPAAAKVARGLARIWPDERLPHDPGRLMQWMLHAAMPFRREADGRRLASVAAELVADAVHGRQPVL